ncbi:AraC family transcriptional regulator [Paenibacillus sp. GCM10027626]|uniref:AraC family transcriptional regulator n=1 Tax=Paenibacillus sp. GCM10027626 TaxID=3273411 RepID=UPI0036329A81
MTQRDDQANKFIAAVNFMNLAPYVRYIHEYKSSESYRIPPRIIYDYEIIFVVSGTCHYVIEGAPYTLTAGCLHVMRPHTLHHCYAPAGPEFHYYAVHFDPVYMGEHLDFSADHVYVNIDYPGLDYIPVEEQLAERPVAQLDGFTFPYTTIVREPQHYIRLFQRMLQLFQTRRSGYHLGMRACMLDMISLLVEELTTAEGVMKQHPHKNVIHEAIHWMEKHYMHDIPLSEFSSQFYLSPNYFRTLFKQATGKTPIEYLTAIRIEKAKQLMQEDSYTISQISTMVGYADLHYFSRLFKKLEGLSPKNYADSILRPSR